MKIIDKIEVWNYNKRKIAGLLKIKNELKSKLYRYEFRRANMTVEIRKEVSEETPVGLLKVKRQGTRDTEIEEVVSE